MGSTPSAYGDTYPLVQSFESYQLAGTANISHPATLPANTTAQSAQDVPLSAAILSLLPGLTVAFLMLGARGFSVGVALLGIIGLVYVALYSRNKRP